MKKHMRMTDIPERGNILSVPIEYLVSIRMMPDDERLEFVTAQMDWLINGAEPQIDGLSKIMFDRWRDYQLVQAENARNIQERARTASSKRWNRMPPPIR